MNISKVNNLQTASFDYPYVDSKGKEQKETVTLVVKKPSFKDSVAKEFREAFEALQDDPERIAELLPPMIHEWNMTDTVDGKEVPWAITKENLLDSRVDPNFVGLLAEAVIGVIAPNPQKDATSETT